MFEYSQYHLLLGLTTYACIPVSYLIAMTHHYLAERFFPKQRIQRAPTKREIDQCMEIVRFNLTWLFFLTILMGPFLEIVLLDMNAPLPGLRESAAKICFFLLFDDVWFYCYHRLCHAVPWLYVRLHKQHHLFTAPFPEVTLAVNPVELIIISMGTCTGPLVIFYGQTHPVLFWAYIVIRQLLVFEDHLGFDVPFSPTKFFPLVFGGATFHDLHHQKFKCNYASTFSIIDRIFGTAK